MLRTIFNEKAEHQKLVDFNYSIQGDIEEIGRIITANFLSHKSANFIAESKKRYRHLMEMLHLQHLLADLDKRLERIDVLMEEIAENNHIINDAFDLLNTDDISGMRELLNESNIDTHLLNDDEIRTVTKKLIAYTITSQQELQNALERELIEFEERTEGLDQNSQDYHQYKAELDLRRSELEKIATQNNLNYKRAEDHIRVYSDANVDVLKKERANDMASEWVLENKMLGDEELSQQTKNKDKILFPELKDTGLN